MISAKLGLVYITVLDFRRPPSKENGSSAVVGNKSNFYFSIFMNGEARSSLESWFLWTCKGFRLSLFPRMVFCLFIACLVTLSFTLLLMTGCCTLVVLCEGCISIYGSLVGMARLSAFESDFSRFYKKCSKSSTSDTCEQFSTYESVFWKFTIFDCYCLIFSIISRRFYSFFFNSSISSFSFLSLIAVRCVSK